MWHICGVSLQVQFKKSQMKYIICSLSVIVLTKAKKIKASMSRPAFPFFLKAETMANKYICDILFLQ